MGRKIFSFFVKAEKTIGSDACAARANYLMSETHENHVASGTKIIKIHGDAQHVATHASLKWAQRNRIKYKSGGRPNHTYGMEYCLSPPKGYQLDKNSARRLTQEIVMTIAPKLNLKPKELAEISYSCVHQQDNAHLNIWFSTITKDGRNIYSKGLSRPSITNAIRRVFNDFCLNEYGLDIDNYVPEKSSPTSKSWQKINDQKKEIKSAIADIQKEYSVLANRKKLLDKKEGILKSILPAQIQKWIDYIHQKNTKRIKSTENRILKSIEKIIDCDENGYLENLVIKAYDEKRDNFAQNIKKIMSKSKLKLDA